MALAPATRLGPYEILQPIGAGGMGEVYRARDTRLERAVAVKILPAHLSSDPVRKQRFEQEAKTISNLNHPHICVLYDIGSQNGIDYLVMECVEGETLAKRLEKGSLPLEKVLKYGSQIADALDKAHRAGIVHRDLKPGNIMLTASGAKLLDFGLAKPSAAPVSGTTVSAAPAQRLSVTGAGTIVGTFPYMSPEQLEGKDVDGRSDIFSLGAVLYQMLTGKRAFEGESELSVATAILEKEPQPLSAIKPMTPLALDHAVMKCLAKHPEERWQSAGDLASELTWISETGANAVGTARPRARGDFREKVAWLIAGASVIALAVVAGLWQASKPAVEALYFPVPLPFEARDIAIAPNGHTIAVLAHQGPAQGNLLWIYELGLPGAKSLGNTEGASYPFWSPDGKSLAFFADAKLKKLDVAGGPVQTICDAPSGRGGTWNRDGVIVFTPGVSGGLWRVPASGGTPMRISSPDASRGEQTHRWPMFLPDGKHYLYLAANFAGQKGVNAIFVGSLDSNEKRFVVEATANAAYAAPGYLLFYRDTTLLAQPFDPKRCTLTGDPAIVLAEIQYQSQSARAVFAVSDHGLLAAQTGSGLDLSQPVWFDRKGKEVGAVGKPGVYGNVFIAPNGKSVAVSTTDVTSQNTDIWVYDLQRDGVRRLTFDPAIDATPVWSPDASRLVFASNRQRKVNMYMKNSDGTQDEKSLAEDELASLPSDWSTDGKYIMYMGGTDLWVTTFPELKSSLFLKAPSVLRNGQFSPDGRWVAYASNETSKWEIYVSSFPDARGRWQISTGGGEQPRWRADGKELFYLSSDGKVMAAPVTTGGKFDAGTPIALFQAAPRQAVLPFDLFVYDVSRDGQRFLINTPVKQAETEPMSIILNWRAKLKK